MKPNTQCQRDGFANDARNARPKRGRYGKPVPIRREDFIGDCFPRWVMCEHPWHSGSRHGDRRQLPETAYIKRWILSQQEIIEAFNEGDLRSLEQPPMVVCRLCAELEYELVWKPPRRAPGWPKVHARQIERERMVLWAERYLGGVPIDVLEAAVFGQTVTPGCRNGVKRWFERDFFVWALKKIAMLYDQAKQRRQWEEKAYGCKTAYYQVLADFLSFIVGPEPETTRPAGNSRQH